MCHSRQFEVLKRGQPPATRQVVDGDTTWRLSLAFRSDGHGVYLIWIHVLDKEEIEVLRSVNTLEKGEGRYQNAR